MRRRTIIDRILLRKSREYIFTPAKVISEELDKVDSKKEKKKELILRNGEAGKNLHRLW